MTSHRNDYQDRKVTKHPGSKRTEPMRPVRRQRVARRADPAQTGVVSNVRPVSGAFSVTYDEGTRHAGRTFWFNSYQIGQFIRLQGESEGG
jgi:hypothetical protein